MSAWSLTDPTLEASILGATIGMPAIAEGLIVDHELTVDMFGHDVHRKMWGAVSAVWEDTRTVDGPAVVAELGYEDAAVDLGHVVERACDLNALNRQVAKLKNLAERRRWAKAGAHLIAAAQADDEREYATADALLRQQQSGVPEPSAQDDVYDWLASDKPAGISTGFPGLDSMIGGGLRPGDVTALGGWTGMGKSVLLDTMLEHAARGGASVHLLMNEMSKRDRRLRLIAAIARVDYARLVVKDLSGDEPERVIRAAGELPFDMTDASGWPAERVARWIRTHPHDLVAFDVLHNMPFRDVRDLDEGVSLLLAAARSTGTHLVLVCHLNDARALGSTLPVPVLRDIRNTGMIARSAATVLMVHRPQVDDAGFVSTRLDGTLEAVKARHGRLSVARVELRPASMRFVAA